MATMVLPTVNTTVMSILNATLVNQTVIPVHEHHMLLFALRYKEVHGYINSVVCIFGLISNILNVIVLTRRHMVTPTNCILTALTIVGFLTMLPYLVYAMYFFVYAPKDGNYSQRWINLKVVHNIFITTCNNMALWFTVALALFRYILVCHHGIGKRLCTMQRAIFTVTIIVMANIIVFIPFLFIYRVEKQTNMGYKVSGYEQYFQSHLMEKHNFFFIFTFWFYGVVMKVSCILLTLLATMVIFAMHNASKRRARLLQQTRPSDHDVNREHNRTTLMLVFVVLLSVITELPYGILTMVSGLTEDFFNEVHSNLNEAIDLITMLNSALNCVLNCIMSQKFRDTFKNLFVINCEFDTQRVTGLHNVYVIPTNTEVTML